MYTLVHANGSRTLLELLFIAEQIIDFPDGFAIQEQAVPELACELIGIYNSPLWMSICYRQMAASATEILKHRYAGLALPEMTWASGLTGSLQTRSVEVSGAST